ncbi:MAG: hypothetical protein V3T49_07325, partial [Dehalococcoidia bacterium]
MITFDLLLITGRNVILSFHFLLVLQAHPNMSIESITIKINSMPETDIAPIAEEALGGADVDGEITWHAEPLNVTSIGNGTVGLWRVSGKADSYGEVLNWSTILKIMDPAARRRTASDQGAVKEIAVMKSGVLDLIETAFRPAPVYQFSEHDDGSYALWMKDLADAIQPPWNGEQFVESARHIGQFNALWT